MILTGVGFFTAAIQKFVTYRLKDNVQLNWGQIAVEILLAILSGAFVFSFNLVEARPILSKNCSNVSGFSVFDESQRSEMDKTLTLIGTDLGFLSYKEYMSCIAVLYSVMTIIMLQRTQSLGDLITMFTQIVNEAKKFIITFGLVIVVFVVVGYSLNTEFKI